MRRLGNFPAGALLIAYGVILLFGSCTVSHPTYVAKSPEPSPTPMPAPVPHPTRAELRGVWVSDTTKLDWDSATANLQHAGFNTIYANLASGGAALYPNSHALPSIVSGSPDPVARGIDLAHQRGLAVHAKQIVTFMFKAPPAFQHELVAADRVMRGPDGHPVMQAGFTWLCPSQEANRELIASSVTEMVKRYPVDGIQFDYIRFCEQPSCFCANCRHEFEYSIGTRVKHWPEAVLQGPYVTQFNNWRQHVINTWIEDLSARARQARPGSDGLRSRISLTSIVRAKKKRRTGSSGLTAGT